MNARDKKIALIAYIAGVKQERDNNRPENYSPLKPIDSPIGMAISWMTDHSLKQWREFESML